jgi:hypothetical protein
MIRKYVIELGVKMIIKDKNIKKIQNFVSALILYDENSRFTLSNCGINYVLLSIKNDILKWCVAPQKY